jgi:hypothetical protein
MSCQQLIACGGAGACGLRLVLQVQFNRLSYKLRVCGQSDVVRGPLSDHASDSEPKFGKGRGSGRNEAVASSSKLGWNGPFPSP